MWNSGLKLAIYLAIFFHLINGAAFESPTVQLGDTVLKGILKDNVKKFLGIPYASAGRWQAPEPATLPESFEATDYGPQCPQNDQQVSVFQVAYNLPYREVYSEECLNLNVIVPAKATPVSNIPVIVYLHSGNFSSGGNGDVGCDPTNWIAHGGQDLVIVTPNYRLGHLGWASHPSFEDAVKGNFGLMDAIEALFWVKRNIKAFGGDPNCVTLLGHSSGGIMCTYLLEILARKNYLAEGQLIHRMIISSANHMMIPLKSSKMAAQNFERLAKEMSMTVEELYKVDWEKFGSNLKPEVWRRAYGPVQDGLLIYNHFSQVLRGENDQTKLLEIPVLLTMIKNDGSLFVPPKPANLPPTHLAKFVEVFMPNHPQKEKVLEIYRPQPKDVNLEPLIGAILTHSLFYAPMQILHNAFRFHGLPAYHFVAYEQDSAATYFGPSEGGIRRNVQLPGTKNLGSFHYTDHLLLFNPTVPKERNNNGQFVIPQSKSLWLRNLYSQFARFGDEYVNLSSDCIIEPQIECDFAQVWSWEADLPFNWVEAGVHFPPLNE